ncbi:hypothetical protein VNO78_24418 [Psophocarpus tetragonolobus]|uniref:Uncharacterized protein n=1 Tax=Psophocarpus tetragonolobus TaxID=3891 RepID=A0AAN9S866_PSOTE
MCVGCFTAQATLELRLGRISTEDTKIHQTLTSSFDLNNKHVYSNRQACVLQNTKTLAIFASNNIATSNDVNATIVIYDIEARVQTNYNGSPRGDKHLYDEVQYIEVLKHLEKDLRNKDYFGNEAFGYML